MASALASLKNATVTFQVATSGVVTDPDTGNVRASITTVSVDCYLKAQTVDYTAFPGVDTTDIIYEGYALSPQALPAGVVVGTLGSLAFSQEEAVECEVLELRLPYGTTGLVGATLSSALGQRLRLVARGQN